jgi:hypothetical protein
MSLSPYIDGLKNTFTNFEDGLLTSDQEGKVQTHKFANADQFRDLKHLVYTADIPEEGI